MVHLEVLKDIGTNLSLIWHPRIQFQLLSHATELSPNHPGENAMVTLLTLDGGPKRKTKDRYESEPHTFRMTLLSLRRPQGDKFSYPTCLKKSLIWRLEQDMQHICALENELSGLKLSKSWPCKSSQKTKIAGDLDFGTSAAGGPPFFHSSCPYPFLHQISSKVHLSFIWLKR